MSFHVQNGIQAQEDLSHKVFVGQIPRTWEEDDLRPLFEEFGDIHHLTILKDKFTGQHKGCAFLTFSSKEAALNAQGCLHEKKTLPGMQNAIQVKPADCETKSEDRKLFIGMVSKLTTEEDLKMMFSPFGTIEEVTVLKNGNGTSKGCAFLKFGTRLQAQNAVIKMHNSTTMEGCSSPIVVKPADTEKDKAKKRMQAIASNLLGLGLSMSIAQGGTGIASNPYQQCQSMSHQTNGDSQLLQQAIAAGTLPAGLVNPASLSMPALGVPGTMGAIVAAAALANQQQQQQQLNQQSQLSLAHQAFQNAASMDPRPSAVASLAQQQQQLIDQKSFSSSALSNSATNSLANLTALSNLAAQNSNAGMQLSGLQNSGLGLQGTGLQGTGLHGTGLQGTGLQGTGLQGTGLQGAGLQGAGLQGTGLQGAGLAGMAASLASSFNSTLQADALSQAAYSGIQQYAAAFPNACMNLFQQQTPRVPQKEGPDGSNLFIYHLPPEFSDADLVQTFLPFGTVVSAKVYIDKNTNLSKCFGFVSYDNIASAANAIQAMNGFSIGNKRLKVQLKRPKDANRPY